MNLNTRLPQISLALYQVACFLPVFREGSINGIQALGFGWMGMAGEQQPIFLCWLANIFYIIALVQLWRKRKAALGLSITAFLLGSLFVFVHTIPESEGGAMAEVSPGIAFPVWMLAMVLVIVGGALLRRGQLAEKK